MVASAGHISPKMRHTVPRMHAMTSTVLPPRIGHQQLEQIHRLAAPSTIFHVHPGNCDKIPCFVSGYQAFALAGDEDRGIVVVRAGDGTRAQRTDWASGVESTRPCFVPVDGMHRDVRVDIQGEAEPFLVRVKVLAVIDEYGVVRHSSQARDGFPGAGQEAYLFPRGIHHRASDYPITTELSQGVTFNGLYAGRSARLTPLVDPRGPTGIPVLSWYDQEPGARLWA